jgi:hypothetical protein
VLFRIVTRDRRLTVITPRTVLPWNSVTVDAA